MDALLVINAGSSSLKFQVFAAPARPDGARDLKCLVRGQMDGIGTRPRLRAATADKKPLTDQAYAPDEVADLPTAIQATAAWLRETQRVNLVAAGHRVVHGGPDYDRPVLLDAAVLTQLERYISLAPLHQPNNLAPIRALLARRPDLPQVACFDTGFHRSHGALADRYAIPEALYAEGVRRYGFHGLSYEYVAERLQQVAPNVADGRVIVAHLGSGASMCALSGGRSVESTMGFTALDGLAMGTRPGQIDPGVILYLIAEKGMTADQVQDLLYRECASRVCPASATTCANSKPAPIRGRPSPSTISSIGSASMPACWPPPSAGSTPSYSRPDRREPPTMRARIADKLAWLGIALDRAANTAGNALISRPDSRVPVYVVPTDEELMIARHTLALLSRRGASTIVSEPAAK